MIDPFPPGVINALWLGIAAGALQGILPIEGWEMIFSMTPFTFHAFWVFAGMAVGLFIGGLIRISNSPASHMMEEKDLRNE